MKLNCLIVDDEPLAQDVLESYVKSEKDLHLVRKCQNALEAREAMRTAEIDLIFLDIQMPEISGIDFLKSLENPPMVIFTTAFPNYAVDGFNLDAVDYLLKPISEDRFKKAMKKVADLYAMRHPQERNHQEGDDDHIFVKADQKLVKLRYDEIDYIEALADYVKIHTADDRRVITLQTMKKMEQRLPSDRFIRVHRSYIVGIRKIKSVAGNKIELKQELIPIGKNYKSNLFDYLQTNNILN